MNNKLWMWLSFSIGMTAGHAFAQHPDMPGHQGLPDGGHVMDAKMKAEMEKRKPAEPAKKQSPPPTDQKHDGHPSP